MLQCFFYLFITVVFVLSWFPHSESASATESTEGFTFEEESGEITLTGCEGSCEEKLIIPASMNDGSPVTQIDEEAFQGKELTHVELPDSLVKIKENAFRDNHLMELTLPDSLEEMESSAFRSNELTSLTLGSGLSSISSGVFRDNDLTTLEIPDNVDLLFSNSFKHNNLTELILPEGISMQPSALMNNQLESVSIPSDATVFTEVFRDNPLSEVTILGPDVELPDEVNFEFGDEDDLTLFGLWDSSAETYADENNIDFEYLKADIDLNTIPGEEYGQVTVRDANEASVILSEPVERNRQIELEAIADDGFRFVEWTENGESVSADASYTFSATEDRSLTASFEAIEPEVSLDSDPEDGGTVSGGGTFTWDEEVTVTAEPEDGFRFVEWTEDGESVSSDASYTFSAKENRSLSASFEQEASPAPPSVVSPPATESDTQIGSDGGTASLEDASISIPDGAIDDNETITIARPASPAGADHVQEGSSLAGDVFSMTRESDDPFRSPVTLTLPYDEDRFNPETEEVSLFWFDEETGEWTELDHIQVNPDERTVSGEIDHFTDFAVIASEQAESVPATPYLTGYPDGTFRADEPVSRAELAVMLKRALHAGDPLTDPALPEDIASDGWYSQAVSFVDQEGLMNGRSDDTFDPHTSITRAEMAAIAVRYQELEPDEADPSFPDTAGHWAEPDIQAASEAELIRGFPNGTFAPDVALTRAEAVTIMNRMFGIEPVEDAASSKFHDLSIRHWAFDAIMTAVGD